MKTAVSISDSIFLRAQKFQTNYNISRSKLYSDALDEYLSKREKQDITAQLNSVYEQIETEEDLDIGLLAVRELTKNDAW